VKLVVRVRIAFALFFGTCTRTQRPPPLAGLGAGEEGAVVECSDTEELGDGGAAHALSEAPLASRSTSLIYV
jgi:hypothetical protein